MFSSENLKFNFVKKFGSKVTSPSIDELSNLLLINPSFIFILFSLTNLNVKKLLNISKLSNPLIFPNWSVVNKTFVDSESTADDPSQPLPLVGLGDASNLILFYEKDAYQFRIAYNKRDRFMQSKPRSWRDGHYVNDYAQVDISGSYDVNENLTVFFEGINITNELTVKTAQYSNQILEVTETGPRYALGIRGSF